ncbi:hypothetical protein [Hyphomonas sp.]|uniref:hypothetical protein n=1 Tax=Hyphomonas sp. TaxID=87 RepID=UPI003918C743
MTLITRTPVLWTLFGLMIAITVLFGALAPMAGGQFLDFASDPADSRALFEAMTPAQRTAHFWITVLVDTAYPLSFGLFFAGMALRFFGKWGPLAAIPGFAVLVVDLTENTLQAITLSGAAYVLEPKAWVSPLKMNLFYLAALIAVVGLLAGIYRRVTQARA